MADHFSPYLTFTREKWASYRRDTPMVLTEKDIAHLHGQIEVVSQQEIEEVYLPLSRLLNLYTVATQGLYTVTSEFLAHPQPKVPYVIGLGGSVSVGKSTASRVLKALLSRWSSHRRVEIVTTDGFLHANAVLEKRGLMNRKGFPESYDSRRLIDFLTALKAGERKLSVPLYDHKVYDVLPDQVKWVDQPDIVIVEGVNVLHVGCPDSQRKTPSVFVSDFFDFSIYVDAPTPVIKSWYMERFKLFRERARHQPEVFFHQFALMPDEEAFAYADHIWEEINACNLNENILPFRERAQLILRKGRDHAVEEVLLRKL